MDQPTDTNPTLISGDSVVGEVAGLGRLAPGKIFAGRHLLLTRLGADRGGILYSAYDAKLDRKVAIKLLRPQLGDRTVQAAERVIEISHPNILTVFEVSTVHDVVFVIMDLVDGESLREWIDTDLHPWPTTFALFLEIGAGLAAAHRAGLPHGELEPRSVLLTRDLEPRIVNFGLDDPPKKSRPDRPLPYRAPERLAGHAADPQADQFGFCVAFYEALHGELPFEGRTPQAIALAIAEGRVRPPRNKVPDWLRRVVLRGLAHDPAKRWPSMDALLEAIERESQRPRRRAIAGVAVGLALLAGGLAIAPDNSSSIATPASPSVCAIEAAEQALAQAWSPDRHAALQQHLDEVGSHWSKPAALSLLLRIDAWSADWHSEWIDACAAEQSEAMLERKRHCLERERRRVAAYIDALMVANEQPIAGSPSALEQLDRLEDCRLSPPPLPDKADRPVLIDLLEAKLDRIRALQLIGLDTRRELADLRDPVDVANWGPLSAEHRLLEVRANLEHVPFTSFEHILLPVAMNLAIAEGDDLLAAEIALELHRVGERHDRVAEARPWLGLAGGLITRAKQPRKRRGEYWLASARAERLADESLQRMWMTADNARTILAELGDDSLLLADAELEMALAAFANHDFEAANEALADAHQRWVRVGGDLHPRTLALQSTAGHFALARGRLADAERIFRELTSRYQAIDAKRLAAEQLLALATAQTRQGAHLHARDSLREAVTLLTDDELVRHVLYRRPQAIEALAALAMHEADRGELELALEHAELALDWAEDPDATTSERAAALHARARVRLRRGEIDKAAADLERVPPAGRSPEYDYEDRYRIALARGELDSASDLLHHTASRWVGLQFDTWHELQVTLRLFQYCMIVIPTCERSPREHLERAREQLAGLQNPDPALADQINRLQRELDP